METLIETREGAIKIVKFNKPNKKNAIDIDMYLRVTKILDEAAEDPNVSVIVLTGVGDYYSSGNDIMAATGPKGGKGVLTPVVKDYIRAFITFPKILVAIVNGPAVGVAATTLPLCDLVFASENSFFYTPFTKLGIVAEGSSTVTFSRLIGERKAADMLLFSHKMSAKEALECGFVNYLYKPEELQSKVWGKIIEISKFAQHSIKTSKKLMRRPILDELLRTNEIEMEEINKILSSSDYQKKSLSSALSKKSKL